MLPLYTGWKNKRGTGYRNCKCGSWKDHWINFSHKNWPDQCSVLGCTNPAKLGAHVINNLVSGEQIIPMCEECNKLTKEFSLKKETKWVSANTQETCDKLR